MDKRRRIQGVVIAANTKKTLVVQVESYRKHPKYKKRVQFRSKYYAHDELETAKVGDTVTIEECRPMSKTKRFRLVSVDKKALESIKLMEEEALEEVLHEEHKEEALKEETVTEAK
ncbi:MAG: 30S ribosomal protein S17 [Firmicutes bacterium]|uniref:Small ribosomal subunit protein uS17 n=1 Tax=Candidatus Onthovivens merdipullorum TaxID=2840889 RepID=A0A9D9DJM4_9BACL|nr:30S ribosomal protein S17 [Candidatus Onthovivens merdipullorum]